MSIQTGRGWVIMALMPSSPATKHCSHLEHVPAEEIPKANQEIYAYADDFETEETAEEDVDLGFDVNDDQEQTIDTQSVQVPMHNILPTNVTPMQTLPTVTVGDVNTIVDRLRSGSIRIKETPEDMLASVTRVREQLSSEEKKRSVDKRGVGGGQRTVISWRRFGDPARLPSDR